MPSQPPLPPPDVGRVAVIGTGLIGGSVALALRDRRPAVEVVAFDRDPAQLALAVESGAVRAAGSPAAAVAQADVVVLAVPTGSARSALSEIASSVRPGALVTDVASVKGPVGAAARELLPDGVAFVGGHPMAGAERGGMAHADALLFENAVYVLTPDGPEVDPRAVWLAESVGARPVLLTAARHDAVVAAVSHLPQLAAVALVGLAAQAGDDALALAAGGFRDMTRIASSPFGMWGDILVANRDAALGALDGYTARLGALRDAVADGDLDALADTFERSATTRAAIPSHSKGFLAPLAEVTLWAEDRVGFLASVTSALADANLNIKDMELLRVREGEGGAFRLAFADGPTADAAVRVLRALGLRAERR
ncbi:prephenate dehydrogenase/arogenate dehydrogenase family protein [Rubrivirga sp.]|uniref:prephenate dehydrogenase/arogenate dehydrogenase family protein n=1 Tax=Rubrivirga sp. TaxID=1885344 RepID=UPI003B5181CC